MIEFKLSKMVVNEYSENQVLVLQEVNGERTLSIVIGIFEIMAIERKVKGWDPPRPLTHDLIESLIRTMGGEMERLVINDLQDGTYYAEINVRLDNKLIMVDCRPSDGIALAVRSNAPIFVEESVLEKASSQD